MTKVMIHSINSGYESPRSPGRAGYNRVYVTTVDDMGRVEGLFAVGYFASELLDSCLDMEMVEYVGRGLIGSGQRHIDPLNRNLIPIGGP